jgi:hypothetical protein
MAVSRMAFEAVETEFLKLVRGDSPFSKDSPV